MDNKITVSNLLELIDKLRSAYALMCKPITLEFCIPKVEFDIIMFLYNNKECFTAKDISRVKKIKPNVVSLHVDKLVQNGYLSREIIEGDRRKIKLIITKKANPIISKGKIIQKDFYDSLNKGLTLEDREIFKKYFTILIENATAIDKKWLEKDEN